MDSNIITWFISKIFKKFQIFQRLLKKLKFLQKFLQNFIFCREIPGRSKIDF